MKETKKGYVISVIGVILLGVGLYLTKSSIEPQGALFALPYVFIGIGCGIFGHGMGNIISNKVLNNSPEIKRQLEINVKDERNVAIANCAKAKAYDMMTFVFGALMISFAIMGVEMREVLLLVFAYLFVQGYAIYYRSKYDKVM
ncbi:DUF6442 family protein [Anaerocolumna chitinilytica]|uniref:DUF2178 domain-containing protein n=1 Tax=Anaerocolumna chitinilytica TaxID=1727145 RepID=A0A7I8DGK6_9FIRM|nr:DUF6442 family protein [Anaerocolumna chitinilytica]BCJ97492.1 hypothetical protein bsdcttw_05330 [Anaerocolumna chitinilytica]